MLHALVDACRRFDLKELQIVLRSFLQSEVILKLDVGPFRDQECHFG
jgi:hypothetical protein